MILPTPDQQQLRLLECLADPTCRVTYWNSDAHGAPANHDCENYGAQWRAYPGRVDDLGGTPEVCSKRALHGSDYPHRWKGCRVWIVALWNWIESDGKYAATKREIVCEIAPESVIDPAAASRLGITSLDGASLYGASLNRASLDRASLNRASLNGASLNGASLNGASLNGASLDMASLNRASLDMASLDGASLNRASLNGASLNGASLNGASLDGASLNRASLNGASLNGASLNGASLNGASLDRASLDGCNMRGILGTTKVQRIDFAARGALFVDVETE